MLFIVRKHKSSQPRLSAGEVCRARGARDTAPAAPPRLFFRPVAASHGRPRAREGEGEGEGEREGGREGGWERGREGERETQRQKESVSERKSER